MDQPITVGEVLTVAIDLEQTGKEFYEALALGCGHRELAAASVRLAQAEARHQQVFQNMRQRLLAENKFPPLTPKESALYRETLLRDVLPRPSEVTAVARSGKVKELLEMAIRMEQDSIRFYQGIVSQVDPAQAATVDRVIAEEQAHLAQLKMISL